MHSLIHPSLAHSNIRSTCILDWLLRLKASLAFEVGNVSIMLCIHINILKVVCRSSIAKKFCNLLKRFATLVVVSVGPFSERAL